MHTDFKPIAASDRIQVLDVIRGFALIGIFMMNVEFFNRPIGDLDAGLPLGATGLAQCTELVEQLRGRAGGRQVEGARLALQHNLGLGGACVVTLYEKV